MKYTFKNAPGATVYDIDARADMRRVLSVDTDSGIVETVVEPLRIDHEENIVTEIARFRSIYPIHGGSPFALLFLCYGRV